MTSNATGSALIEVARTPPLTALLVVSAGFVARLAALPLSPRLPELPSLSLPPQAARKAAPRAAAPVVASSRRRPSLERVIPVQ
jgi:hypothetical protein